MRKEAKYRCLSLAAGLYQAGGDLSIFLTGCFGAGFAQCFLSSQSPPASPSKEFCAALIRKKLLIGVSAPLQPGATNSAAGIVR